MLGLRFCARAFSSCGEWGPLFIAVRGPLTIAASLVAEHRLQTRRLSSCGSRAQLLRGMWDPPRPGLKPVCPALAGRLSTTVPPGKPPFFSFNISIRMFVLPWFFSHLYCHYFDNIYIYFFWIISSSYICLSLPWYWPTIVATFRYLSATDAPLGKVCYPSLQLFSLRNYNEEIKPSFPEIQKLSYPEHDTLEYKCLYWTWSHSLLPK